IIEAMGQDRPPDLEKFRSKDEIIALDNTNSTQKESMKMTKYNSRKSQNTNAIYVATSRDESAKIKKIHAQSSMGLQADAHEVYDRSNHDLHADQISGKKYEEIAGNEQLKLHGTSHCRTSTRPDSDDFHTGAPPGDCRPSQERPTHEISGRLDRGIDGNNNSKIQ
ncbi:hypothetical protein HAX54_007527, partial [Datura stramonium]|nr:hypothetical protein [Datura stramonium]